MADLQINNYSTLNVFIWNNRYQSRTTDMINSSGSDKTYAPGLVLGKIASSGLLVPMDSTATDGSQVPMGILAAAYSIVNGAQQPVAYCIAGDVDANAIVFAHTGDTLDTEIATTDSGSATTKVGTIGDILIRSGIIPVASSENSYNDNQ